MGIFHSKPVDNKPKVVNQQPKEVQKEEESGIIIKNVKFDKEDIKILILGPGECGKSTYWRQMRNLYTGGLTIREKKALIPSIRENLIADIKVILNKADELNIDISRSLEGEMETIREEDITSEDLTPEYADAISAIWEDPGAKLTYDQIHSCWLSDHSAFFLDSCKRIADADYIPTDEDIIKTRVRTTGIHEVKFDINNKKVLLVDVGGQRCERNKWQSAFANVNAIIFVISLSDFDQTMFESEGEFRTKDSIDLFSRTIKTDVFCNIPVYLVLNKEDEFKRKLKLYPEEFKKSYPEFTGDVSNEEEAINYIKELYIGEGKERGDGAKIIPFVTSVVEKERFDKTFRNVCENIIEIETD